MGVRVPIAESDSRITREGELPVGVQNPYPVTHRRCVSVWMDDVDVFSDGALMHAVSAAVSDGVDASLAVVEDGVHVDPESPGRIVRRTPLNAGVGRRRGE